MRKSKGGIIVKGKKIKLLAITAMFVLCTPFEALASTGASDSGNFAENQLEEADKLNGEMKNSALETQEDTVKEEVTEEREEVLDKVSTNINQTAQTEPSEEYTAADKQETIGFITVGDEIFYYDTDGDMVYGEK